MLLENRGEIAPERMKRLRQSENNAQFVDVTGDGSRVQCCKEQYYIEIWNVRSTNQGNLEVVKQEMKHRSRSTVKTGHGTRTCSKLGKECVKAVSCHPAF